MLKEMIIGYKTDRDPMQWWASTILLKSHSLWNAGLRKDYQFIDNVPAATGTLCQLHWLTFVENCWQGSSRTGLKFGQFDSKAQGSSLTHSDAGCPLFFLSLSWPLFSNMFQSWSKQDPQLVQPKGQLFGPVFYKPTSLLPLWHPRLI